MLREIEKLTGIKLEQRKHDLPPLEETKTTPIANVARKVQAKAPAEKQQGKQNNKRRESRKPAEPLKNTQQATVVAEKPKRHNRPAKPKLVREPQQKHRRINRSKHPVVRQSCVRVMKIMNDWL